MSIPTPEQAYRANDEAIPSQEKALFIADLGGAIDNNVAHKNAGNAETIRRQWVFEETPKIGVNDIITTAEYDYLLSAIGVRVRRTAVHYAYNNQTGNITVDFTGADSITVNAIGSVNITITNVPTGQVCKLKVSRTAPESQTVTFANVNTVDGRKHGVTNLYYDIWNFNDTSITARQSNVEGSVTPSTTPVAPSSSYVSVYSESHSYSYFGKTMNVFSDIDMRVDAPITGITSIDVALSGLSFINREWPLYSLELAEYDQSEYYAKPFDKAVIDSTGIHITLSQSTNFANGYYIKLKFYTQVEIK